MSLLAPTFLVGLLTIPLYWLLMRARSKPVRRALPSIQFLEGEPTYRGDPRRRQRDPRFWLTAAALAALSLGAAGPVLAERPKGRIVRVVVEAGALAAWRPYAAGVDSLVKRLETEAGPGDAVEVVRVGEGVARPELAALLAAALDGRATHRLVLSDRRATEARPDVQFIDPLRLANSRAPGNVGIVAAELERRMGGARLWLTIEQSGAESAGLEVRSNGGAWTRIGFAGQRGVRHALDLTDGERPLVVDVRPVGGGSDDFPLDDRLVVDPRPPRLALTGLAADDPVVESTTALTSSLGFQRVSPGAAADVHITTRREEARELLGRGVTGRHRPVVLVVPDADRAGLPLRGRRLVRAAGATIAADLLGFDFRWFVVEYAVPDAAHWAEARGVLFLDPDDGARSVTLLTRLAPRLYELHVDPRRGTPVLLDTPFWPMLFAALLDQVGRTEFQGLLDPEATRYGGGSESARGAPPQLFQRGPIVRRAATRQLRPWVVLLGLILLLVSWVFVPRRTGVRPAPGAP